LVWLRAIAAAGHECHVVCGATGDQTGPVDCDGIRIERYAGLSRDASPIREAVDRLEPDFVLVSSEDVSHTILRECYRASPARIVYLAHTPQWFPFGPEAWHQDREAAAMLREALAIVAIGRHMAQYIEEHLGRSAEVLHPSIYGEAPWPEYSNFGRGKILLINPCQVKGLPIFLELARRLPELHFAALRGWGTNAADLAALRSLPNVELLQPVPVIDEVFANTSVLLAPSLWYEGFGLVATEALLRGIPVLASDYGGLAESTASSEMRQPISPIRQWTQHMDDTGMPVGVLPEQPFHVWASALARLCESRDLYEAERARGMSAARAFVEQWRASDLLDLLARLAPKRRRILLVHNSTYFPASGGGDKSNRLLLESLVRDGHTVEVFTRLERFGEEPHNAYREQLTAYGIPSEEHSSGLRFRLNGVAIHAITRESNLRRAFRSELERFAPEVILASTDDPAHLFLDIALEHGPARVVYLVRATIALPFGPDASTQNPERTARLARVDAVVGVSHYVAEYCRTYANLDAVHVPISLADDPSPPDVGNFENPYVTLINPSGVKGLPILLGLADSLPQIRFAAVPSWGTTPEDIAAMRKRKNISILPRADDITDILRQTRATLVPSLWAEARSRVVLESLSRGVPVLASDVGGLREAMCGMEYVLPVNPITQYKPSVSDQMAPEAVVPPQDIGPWRAALEKLTSDHAHWTDLSRAGRAAALSYIRGLSSRPLEFILDRCLAQPKNASTIVGESSRILSPERRRLLHLRVQRMLSQKRDRFFPLRWESTPGAPLLVLFPWAGAGGLSWRFLEPDLRGEFTMLPVVLPQREGRTPYAEGTTFATLAAAIGRELQDLANARGPIFFLGHSMGAALAYEVARVSTRPLALLVASSCRAPHLRLQLESAKLPSPGALSALDADIALFDAYRPEGIHPIDTPIVALAGLSEDWLSSESVSAWAALTQAGFREEFLAGDHFWIKQHPRRLAELLLRSRDEVMKAL
jgi:surfactin synthase thioesterase subunit/glycosyltransferase involved in cell wall biosynthesis